jgi:hypothetical protein
MRKHRNREKIFLKNSLSLDYSLKHIEDARIKIKDTFAESSKEEKCEESCLRSSCVHNDHVSRTLLIPYCATAVLPKVTAR